MGKQKQKRVKLFTLIAICVLSLTSCIADSSWLGLGAKWQDVENPANELEFTKRGQFKEYLFGELVGYGDFKPEGNIVNLHYSSLCGGKTQISCDVHLKFTVTGETLIITDKEGDIRFKKIADVTE